MNVFSDFHHNDLFYSLITLFEKRMGWNIYAPIGREWFDRGYWNYNLEEPVINQYLNMRNVEPEKDGHHKWIDPNHHSFRKAITLEQFEAMDIDVILASVTNHIEPMLKLQRELKPNAKMILQLGNEPGYWVFNIHNLLISLKPRQLQMPYNAVFYHQEFPLDVFSYKPPGLETGFMKTIKNFMNCLPHIIDAPLYHQYKAQLKEFTWKMFGISGDDGIIGTIEEIAKEMQDSTFIWHVKAHGDGFGHIIHNAYACGRPCIVKKSYYKDRWGETLLSDGQTCLDLEQGTLEENIKRIRFFSRPEEHQRLCENAYNRFKSLVNFDAEFKQIKEFLNKLI